MKHVLCGLGAIVACVGALAQVPGPIDGGYLLPNGWSITPVGKSITTKDLLLNIQTAPDGRAVVALHGGFNAHGLVVLDAAKDEAVQRIALPTAWLGLAWHPNGSLLFVSGGNHTKKRAPVYVFSYKEGRLSDAPVRTLEETIDGGAIFWSGLAHHPKKDILFAANRTANNIVVFDSASGAILERIPVEKNPYDLAITPDGAMLYCSNWASDSVSVIDCASLRVVQTIDVGDNPNAMALATKTKRLFVACSNDNCVAVIDTEKARVTEKIVTSLYEGAPEGSTPNALALSPDQKTLYAANANIANVAVIKVEDPGESEVCGFIPSGWYPASVAVGPGGKRLYIGNAKGDASYSNIRGPHSPLPPGPEGNGSVKSLMEGSISILPLPLKGKTLRRYTKKVIANSPYNNSLLAEARPPKTPSVIPSKVGKGSPIKHVIYIIKENRTYDQVLGDMPQGNGDPRITIFGRDITPNAHAIAEQFVLLDNTFCDAEVSESGHEWSSAAYATDFIEKNWPAGYAGKSDTPRTEAALPAAGFIWDRCARKGLTYRSYGECAARVSQGKAMESRSFAPGLSGHVAPNYQCWGARDDLNAAEFIREFDEYEKHYDDANPKNRLPAFIIMSLPEDHTVGAQPGRPTPRAAVANNDYALGLILERVSHSRYWPELALFTIEDDAQDGSDHVDARRTVALVASPYCHRGVVDSTLYTTSSLLRTIELLLGLHPMSQFDAAANPMYAAFAGTPDLTPYVHREPTHNVNEKNAATAWGAKESMEMNLSGVDQAPMFALNEIVWKSVRGAESPMPVPVHRFQCARTSDPD